MNAILNYFIEIITKSTLAYIVIICILKLNGFKVRDNSRIPLSKVIKRLLLNAFLLKIISEEFGIYTLWYNYTSYVQIVWLVYAISFIATIIPMIITSRNKTIFNALSIN